MVKRITKSEKEKLIFSILFWVFIFMASSGVKDWFVNVFGDSWRLTVAGISGLLFLAWYYDLSRFMVVRR